jgi:2-keto-3-deoxy-L-rhamnonate aldolase RhmA
MIGFALDAGASVVIPQVDTVEEAQHVVSATKFGVKHKGTRSAPPARWFPGSTDMKMDASKTIWENINNQAAIIIQIESELGIKNLDAILTAVGDRIDAVWIGTVDLRASMGLEGAWGDEPSFMAAIRTYEEVLRKHQMPNSGQCLDLNWTVTSNKVLTLVASDWLALLDTRNTISTARKHLPASDKRLKMANGSGVFNK